MIAPFSACAIALARVVPFGLIRKRVLAEAEEPSTIAFVSPSSDLRSPKYSSA